MVRACSLVSSVHRKIQGNTRRFSRRKKMKPINALALTLGLAVLFCMPMYADEKETTTYNFETINYTGDTFTQLLGINNSDMIAGYHGVTVNQCFTLALSNRIFTTENF